jgi:prepilin-type N-terminal cleavage/methylation domain-containing protein
MRTQHSRSGFTLMEVMIVITILGGLLGAVAMFQLRSEDSFQATSAQARADSLARQSMARIMEAVSGSSNAVFVPDPTSSLGTDTLTFQQPTAVSNAGVVTWSNQMRFALALDTGEVDNGLDDNGNGLIDERRLVLTLDVNTLTPKSVTLCHGVAEWYPGETGGNAIDDNGNGVVDERGFSVRRVGDLLNVRLAVQVGYSKGRVATATTDTALVLHN